MKNRVETRGRKSLYDEETKRLSVVVPFTLYEILTDLAFKSGKGVSHHVREACVEMFKRKRQRKKRP